MDITMTPEAAFAEALRIAGSQAALAAIIGKQQAAISKRLKGSATAQPEEVLRIEAATGVARHALRPDIYLVPADPASATPSEVESIGTGGGIVADNPAAILLSGHAA